MVVWWEIELSSYHSGCVSYLIGVLQMVVWVKKQWQVGLSSYQAGYRIYYREIQEFVVRGGFGINSNRSDCRMQYSGILLFPNTVQALIEIDWNIPVL